MTKTHFISLAAFGFSYNLELTVQGSEYPLQWKKVKQGKILSVGKFLESPKVPLQHHSSFKFFAHIPLIAQKLFIAVPYLSFELAQASLLSKEAKQLTESAPLLFILLVEWAKNQNISAEKLRKLVLAPRNKIAKTIGLLGSKALIKILAKTNFTDILEYELSSIRTALSKTKNIKHLSHLPTINTAHYILLAEYQGKVSSALLKLLNTCATNQKQQMARLIIDCQSLGAKRGQIERAENIAGLEALHDHQIIIFNMLQEEQLRLEQEGYFRSINLKLGTYPAVPIRGNENVIPITSWEELLDEGSEMNHCVGSYSTSVASGSVFIYRMNTPQRLTISIRRTLNNWVLDEIKGHSNQVPSDEAVALVNTWFTSALKNQSY